MPHKEPKKEDDAYAFYKGHPYELRKGLREPFPEGVCSICSNEDGRGCEKKIKERYPKSGLCSSFLPPKNITFTKVLEASSASRRGAIRILLGRK